MRQDIGPEPIDFALWALDLKDLEPPAELEKFHAARVGQYILQVEYVDNVVRILGLNERTDFWWKREIIELSGLSRWWETVLVEGGCLLEGEVEASRRILAAVDRMESQGFYHPGTVEEYLEACSAITLTTPQMAPTETMYRHVTTNWAALEPPKKLADYHSAILEFHKDWARVSWDITRVNPDLIDAVGQAAAAVGSDFVGDLVLSGCTG